MFVACCRCRGLLLVVVCGFKRLRLFVALFCAGCCLCATRCVKITVYCVLFVVCGLIRDCNSLSYDVWRLLFVVWCCVLFVVCSVTVLAFFVERRCVLFGVNCFFCSLVRLFVVCCLLFDVVCC